MTRTLLWILGGLMLGAVIHIATVFGVPRFAEQDAWSRLSVLGDDFKFNVLPRAGDGATPIPLLDPAFLHAVCRFNLEKAPVRIRATPPDAYFSFAIYDRRGLNLYNLNDRGTGQKPIDLLIATAEQIAQIREAPPEDFNDLIIVDWKSEKGFAVVRIFAPGPDEEVDAQAAVKQMRCEPNQIGQ